jgi:hypothetical protein
MESIQREWRHGKPGEERSKESFEGTNPRRVSTNDSLRSLERTEYMETLEKKESNDGTVPQRV